MNKEQLQKLIPLLGSDQSGEVLAAVAAIRRTLSAEKLDLHDLARALGQVRPPNLLDMAAALKRQEQLNEWEVNFVKSIHSQLAAGARLTDKQEQALRRTYAKFH